VYFQDAHPAYFSVQLLKWGRPWPAYDQAFQISEVTFLSFSFLFTSFHLSPCELKPEREIDAKFLPAHNLQ
jgi:hypothetical protein